MSKKEIISEDGPWKTLKSEQVHDTPWIQVTQHDVINPGGHEGQYSVVHFKNLAIGIIPLDEDLNTWIVGQYRYPLKQYSWEIPEGGGEIGVDPLDSAKRELSEETGIKAENWRLIKEFHTSNSATDEHAFLYLAQGLSFHEAHPDDDEQLEVKKVSFEEFFKMVENGEIMDSLSVVAAYQIKLMIDRGELS